MSGNSKSKEIVEDDAVVDALLAINCKVFPMVFKAALELNLFDIIAQAGHASSSHIASQLPTRNPEEAALRLDRLLGLLATHSFLTCSDDYGHVQRLYGLTPKSRLFVSTAPISLTSTAAAFNNLKSATDVWYNVKEAILEGGSQFEKVHGMSMFEYMDKDPEFNNTFNQAMAEFTTVIMNKVLEIYKGFEGLESLVDVGGGTGQCLNMIVSKYPSLKAINFDLPHVAKTAPSYIGVEHVGGDMFSTIPKADAVIIKDTLHNWDDESCIQVLRNCHESLPKNGKVIVISLIMSEESEQTKEAMYVSRMDNIMLMQARGKERTQKEFEALCTASGFSNFSIICLAFSLWAVMEFTK